MNRRLLVPAAALVFVAGFILDPAGVVQLTYVCATGGCGIPKRWLAIAAFTAMAMWAAVAIWGRVVRTRRRAAPRKPRAAGRRGAPLGVARRRAHNRGAKGKQPR